MRSHLIGPLLILFSFSARAENLVREPNGYNVVLEASGGIVDRPQADGPTLSESQGSDPLDGPKYRPRPVATPDPSGMPRPEVPTGVDPVASTPSPVRPPVAGLDCTDAANSYSAVCACQRDPSFCVPTPTGIGSTGPGNAESAGPTISPNEKKKERNPVLVAVPQDPNLIVIKNGDTVSTRPTASRPESRERAPAVKANATALKNDDVYDGTESSRSPASEKISEPTGEIAWSVGSKKPVETQYIENGPPQGFTLSGGRSNWEKIRQRYYDNAGTFERPDALPPAPNAD